MKIQEIISKIGYGRTVYIMRGLPGSGKSTAAKEIFKSYDNAGFYCEICSADDYWINDHGEYAFDATKVPLNHHWCLRGFIQSITKGLDCVIVDNTNLSVREFSHYIKLAQAYGYKVVILNFICSVEDSIKRNVHNVPKSTIGSMDKRFNNEWDKVATFIRSEKIDSFTIDNTDGPC